MASPDALIEEDICYFGTQSGIGVRTIIRAAWFLLMLCSTCIVTLIRVVEIHKESVTVITANYAVIGTATLLEPLLGIITCIIPLL
jgi:hypothetical protein